MLNRLVRFAHHPTSLGLGFVIIGNLPVLAVILILEFAR